MRRPNDPLGNFRFVLELGFLQAAGFSECTGLTLETKVYEYREGGRNGHALKFPDAGSVGTVTLKRGIVAGPAADVLYRWQRDVMTGAFDPAENPNQRPGDPNQDLDNKVTVVLLDETGQHPLRRWRLVRPFPTKWTGPELKAAGSEVAIETLELACEGIELS